MHINPAWAIITRTIESMTETGDAWDAKRPSSEPMAQTPQITRLIIGPTQA